MNLEQTNQKWYTLLYEEKKEHFWQCKWMKNISMTNLLNLFYSENSNNSQEVHLGWFWGCCNILMDKCMCHNQKDTF